MGIFNFFSNSDRDNGSESTKTRWKLLSSEEDLNTVLDDGSDKLKIIFKHSPACSVSFFAQREMNKLGDEITEIADLYIVNVIGDRPVSNEIARRTGVRHESPQLLFLHEGEVIWNGSHHHVTAKNVKKIIEAITEQRSQ